MSSVRSEMVGVPLTEGTDDTSPEQGRKVNVFITGRWPDEVDNLPSSSDDPEGWHVREKTCAGYPLMGSSPAERAERRERGARIKAQAMRDHPFTGEGPYCQARISFWPMGSAKTGTITGWSGCGYPLDMHPEQAS